MKLTEIHVDGFGVWNDLRLRELSPDVTVLYGPNEAGKTTLMHFLRAMLYGVTSERRERYLPPREGGRPGGSLGLLTSEGPFQLERYVERGDDDRGRVAITLPDGEQQGDRLLRDAMESVDERTYCNVFAIGLDEINELGALEGAEAARWIYRLTSGLDRVSLYDVIQGLRSSRKQLIAPAGERSLIADLLGKRDKLRTQIDELTIEARRWSKLAVEIDEVDAHTDQLQGELRETERKARRIEIALGLKPLWTERERVIEDRHRFDKLQDLGDNPLKRLEDLNTKAEEHQRQRHTIRGQRRELHQEVKDLGINEVLMRSCCRLDALSEQQDWLDALERQSAELSEEVERLDARVEAETARLAKLWRHKPSPEAAPDLDEEMMEVLRPASDSVRDAERLVADAKRDLDALRGHERNYDAQLEGALTSSERLGLPLDIESAGELVSTLRRRLKAEQKVEQSRRHVADLEVELDKLIERQVLPVELFTLLCTAFAAAGVVIFWSWIAFSTSSAWWPLAFLAALGAVFARYLLEDSRAMELDACRQQIEMANKQIETALGEQNVLDEDLPLKEGSVVVRLQHAEQHLEELERMLPVEAERRKASLKTKSAEEYFKSANEELVSAEKEWRSTLKSVGLPDDTTAAEVEKLAGQYAGLAEIRSRSEVKQEDLERCEREHEKLAKRIVALAEEADLVVEDAETPEQLEHLLSEHRLQKGRIDHRKKLRDRAKELKERQHKHEAMAERVEADLLSLFSMAKVEDEQAFRQVVADLESAAKLDENRQRLTREIAAAIGASGTEADYLELMSRDRILRLDGLWTELTAEHDRLEKQLRELAAKRAVLKKDRQTLVEDTALGDKQVALDLVEVQLTEAKERWRERAAVGSMLELIRSDYEEHRQPETLIEASKYLERFTQGRYPRVWTPLADDVLLVDTADGESLPVESLSRGTREQLFLSVRMALVATFARRGVQLPMILDDVLVNFDDRRARIAASVMTEFAAEGHQLLVFTCHEHVRGMFKDLNADVRRLPARYETDEPEIEEVLVVEEVVIPEPEPVVEEVIEVVTPLPAPKPAYVDAEYLPLEPLTETRRVVEEVVEEVAEEVPAPPVLVATPAPALAEVLPPAQPVAPPPATHEIAYGGKETNGFAYDTPATPSTEVPERYTRVEPTIEPTGLAPSTIPSTVPSTTGVAYGYDTPEATYGYSADYTADYPASSEADPADANDWLDEAREEWSEPTDART